MEPIVGSVMQVIPALPGWSVLFADAENEKSIREEPIVAWAVVVIYVGPNDDEPTRREYQTEVQPLTISQEGITEIPLLREDVVQLAILQPGQIRIAQEAE